jgi:hypothetical protein
MAVIQHTEKNGGGGGDDDDGSISGWMDRWMDQWMDGSKDGWTVTRGRRKQFQVVWNSLQVFCTSKSISDQI